MVDIHEKDDRRGLSKAIDQFVTDSEEHSEVFTLRRGIGRRGVAPSNVDWQRSHFRGMGVAQRRSELAT
jgi:hypothetical protein